MKKILSAFLTMILSSFLFAGEIFYFAPQVNEIYTSREIAIAGNYCADYSTFFSILANPANAALTGDKKLFPFISADMNGDLKNAYGLVQAVSSNDSNKISEFISGMSDIPLNINMSGPICFGSVKNGFEISFFNSTYSKGTLKGVENSVVAAGEQYLFNLTYAYPIKFANSALAVGLGTFAFVDIQGYYEGLLSDALTYIKDKGYSFFPLFATAGFGLNAGVSLQVERIFTFGIAWNDFFGMTITQKFDSLSDVRAFNFKKYDPLGTMPLGDNLTTGFGFNLPLDECTKHFLTQTHIFVQYDNLNYLFKMKENGLTFNPSMLYQTLSFGVEVEMFRTIALRYGMNNRCMTGGIGLKAGMVHLDVSLYSTKIGFTKNDSGSIGVSLSFGIYQ